jgi:hypothetical protein
LKQPKEIATFLATFCFSSFKTWFVEGILRFQNWFDVAVLGFKIELCGRHFGLFGLGDNSGYFLKNWGIFFSNLLVTLKPKQLGIFISF